MNKYSKELIWDYITGNDVDNIDELENDYKFIMEVIKVTKDKNMYNLCSEEMKSNYELVKFMVETFKEDKKFVSMVANQYLEKIESNDEEDITRFELIIIMCDIFANDDSDEALLYNIKHSAIYNKLKVEINLALYENPDLKDKIGLGFSYIVSKYNNNEIINKDFATNYLNEIFYTNEEFTLEELVHKKFSSFEDLKKYGIKKFILDYVKGYDAALSDYLYTHLDLIKGIEYSINNIGINWQNYLDKILKRKNAIFLQEASQLIEEYNVLFNYEEVCRHIDKLNLGIPVKLWNNRHYDFVIEDYVADEIFDEIDLIDEKNMSLNDYKCLKEIIKLAKELFSSEGIDRNLKDSYLNIESNDKETKIIDFPDPKGHSK